MSSAIKDEWLTAEGRHEGQRLIVRLNTGVGSLVAHKKYPFRIGIAIPFNSPQENGLPNKDELQRFERIEDTIFNRFQVDETAVLCAILTTNGMREFILYSQIDDISTMLEDVSSHFSEYNFQRNVEQDADWQEYAYWAKRLGQQ